ncbi:Nicotianamine synthase [Pleomassaria siparia CBS 279.74]|uniref:Nicotianamine synthase n=1 Tax=Pleomassaria siparia CBS 279.74 TaxID=1314801 RepID=A0A6G1K698_9PLEO|nr:Nicotianamine synthase [Pleomassaria siparia CBS 279.74]
MTGPLLSTVTSAQQVSRSHSRATEVAPNGRATHDYRHDSPMAFTSTTKSVTNEKSNTEQEQPSDNTPPSTPTAMSTDAHAFVEEVRTIYSALIVLPDLAPGQQINALLSRLVYLCIEPRGEDLADYVMEIEGVEELCEKLRPLCAEAEGELERHWAERMIATANSQLLASPKLLTLFPYYDNYVSLSRLECSLIESFLPSCSPSHRPSPCSISFIGSGPLPLTSFCILDRYPEAMLWNVDRDQDALRLSEELATKVGYGSRMRFVSEDVSLSSKCQGKASWRNAEVVFLAALVGLDNHTKMGILRDLARQLRPGTLVVARSARGLRRALYPVLELSDHLQRTGFDILAEVHPWTKVVNSVVLLSVR